MKNKFRKETSDLKNKRKAVEKKAKKKEKEIEKLSGKFEKYDKHEQEFNRMMERVCEELSQCNIKLNDGRLLRMKYVTHRNIIWAVFHISPKGGLYSYSR